jgi:hypothetical protein
MVAWLNIDRNGSGSLVIHPQVKHRFLDGGRVAVRECIRESERILPIEEALLS